MLCEKLLQCSNTGGVLGHIRSYVIGTGFYYHRKLITLSPEVRPEVGSFDRKWTRRRPQQIGKASATDATKAHRCVIWFDRYQPLPIIITAFNHLVPRSARQWRNCISVYVFCTCARICHSVSASCSRRRDSVQFDLPRCQYRRPFVVDAYLRCCLMPSQTLILDCRGDANFLWGGWISRQLPPGSDLFIFSMLLF